MRLRLLLAFICALVLAGGCSKKAAHEPTPGRPVIFLGLDGADWTLLEELARDGTMPNLAALMRAADHGVLNSIHPPLSPLVWTTMMTGVGPLEHRILDFTRFHPETGSREPITSDERAVPAVWNMATYAGKQVAVFGVWATYPAEQVRGIMVSDRLFSFQHQERSQLQDLVYPPDRQEWARGVVERFEDGTPFESLREYFPWLTEREFQQLSSDPDPYRHPVTAFRRVLIETDVYHRLATEWIARERPDLTIVYFQGTDAVGHLFAAYEGDERYGSVPRRYFAYIDRLLGDYRRLAERQNALLMLASDHGFYWKEGRPTAPSDFRAPTAARWHRREGIWLVWPANPGRNLASVSDVCPTLLDLLGLPSADSFRREFRRARQAPRSATSDAEVAKLRALGYVGGAEPDRVMLRGSTRTAGSFNNEGLLLKEAGRTEEALAAFAGAIELDPNYPAAMWNLSDMLEKTDPVRSDELLIRALRLEATEGVRRVIARAGRLYREGDRARTLRLLDQATAVRDGEPQPWLFRGRYRLEAGACADALRDFAKAARLAPADALTHSSKGLARLCLGDRAGARADFQRSLRLDPNQPQLRQQLDKL